MQIEQYIKELLIFQDCVIVPGFGGFVSNYQSARQIDGQHGAFCPPAKRIVFNQKLQHNDGLLIDYVSRQENCSFETAKEEVSKFVLNNKKELANMHQVCISGLGVLSSTKTGFIRFDQSVEDNLLVDSFGLGQIQVQLLEVQNTKRKISVKLIKRLSVAASVAILIAFIPSGFYSKIESASFNFFDSRTKVAVKTIAENLEGKSKIDSEIISKLEEQTNKSTALFYVEPPKQTLKQDAKSYAIIIGCYIDEKHLDKALNEAKSLGYEATILKQDNEYCTYRRISVGIFLSRKEADSALLSIKSSYKDAWVLSK